MAASENLSRVLDLARRFAGDAVTEEREARLRQAVADAKAAEQADAKATERTTALNALTAARAALQAEGASAEVLADVDAIVTEAGR